MVRDGLTPDRGHAAPDDHGHDVDSDAAIARFEDVLFGLPLDRVLPDIDELLSRAKLPRALLTSDDRALKLLHEAVIARPWATPDQRDQVRSQVALLELEVEVLLERLGDASVEPAVVRATSLRIRAIRDQLDGLRRVL